MSVRFAHLNPDVLHCLTFEKCLISVRIDSIVKVRDSFHILSGACYPRGSQEPDTASVCSYGPCTSHHQGKLCLIIRLNKNHRGSNRGCQSCIKICKAWIVVFIALHFLDHWPLKRHVWETKPCISIAPGTEDNTVIYLSGERCLKLLNESQMLHS